LAGSVQGVVVHTANEAPRSACRPPPPARGQGLASRHLESRPNAAARLVLEGVCRVSEPILSRPVGWRRSAALHPRCRKPKPGGLKSGESSALTWCSLAVRWMRAAVEGCARRLTRRGRLGTGQEGTRIRRIPVRGRWLSGDAHSQLGMSLRGHATRRINSSIILLNGV
jgi:hypothetical protein